VILACAIGAYLALFAILALDRCIPKTKLIPLPPKVQAYLEAIYAPLFKAWKAAKMTC
jgi:hypothetical protein